MIRALKADQDASREPEQLFIERYEKMQAWSLQLTGYDHDLARDLLHDLFIQFVLNGPDTETIENLDGYLYISLRNLHIAQQRRANRNRLVQLSIVEYDSAEIGLSTIDFRDQLIAHDELRRVCQYACSRKEHAKIASVLILRFLHGYYPDEITRVAGSPRPAIDKWIKLGRGEAKAFLEKDSKVSFISKDTPPAISNEDISDRPDDLLDELREMIFRSRHGKCFDAEELLGFYPKGDMTPLECSALAHIVSCAACLDGVNALLDLTPLAERRATETLSRDKNKTDKDGNGGSGAAHGGGLGGGSGSGSGGGMNNSALAMMRRGLQDTFVHRPQELCVAVNGYALGSQRVSAERNELNLVVERNEPIDFVEIYTEQKIRLLMHNVEEQPPAGPGERSAIVRLSDDRFVELSLRFTSPSPTIQVVYLDPGFNRAEELAEDFVEVSSNHPAATRAARTRSTAIHTSFLGLDQPEMPEPPSFLRSLASVKFWLRPATLSFASVLLALGIGLIYFNLGPGSTITTASEALRQAANAEAALAARTDFVLHRTIDVEERVAANGEVRSRKRIDVWQNGERKATARRMFDESGRLLAGAFTSGEGSIVYTKKNEQPVAEWQDALSAKDFSNLVAKNEAEFTDSGDRYVVSYRGGTANARFVSASLVINKADLRPVEQTLTMRRGGPNANDELVEYHFVESVFEQRSPNSVPPSVFEPDAELLVPDVAVATKTENKAAVDEETAANTNSNSNAAVKPPTAIATADLEVEVLRLLNQAGADIDDQTNVTRTADGRLQVTGLVDGKEKKSEILKALSSISNNPALVIRVETYEDAAARQKPTGTPTSVERIEVTKGRIAVYEDVARHLGKSGDADADVAVQRFSASVLNRSRLVMSQAGTLKKLSGRFSRDDLKNMTPEARQKWLAVVRSHASNCEAENRKLRQDLSALFGISSGGAGDGGESIDTDAELQAAAARLFAEAAANDRVIRSAFTISGEGSSLSPIKNQAFLRAMSAVERLAASLQRAK